MAKIKDLLTHEDLKPENIKANITIRISGDVLDAYRKKAAELGIGYQTLMQMKLREALENEERQNANEQHLIERVENLERIIGRRGLQVGAPSRTYRTSGKRRASKRTR